MTAAGGVEIRRDLTYATVDGRPLKLDLYLPTGVDGRPPVVLYLHGGGFVRGDRTAYAPERLVPIARRGIAVASAQYRFSDVAIYPAQVHDVKAAVRWLRAHAAEHGYTAERVGVWGASAGAYLALMLGVTAGSAEHEGTVGEDLDHRSTVEAVTAWFAPTDLLSAEGYQPPADWERPAFVTGPPPVPSFQARLLGVEHVAEHPDLAAAASPITHAASATAAFLLMHGDRDALMSEQQSMDMHAALVAAGVDSTLLLIAGANHEDAAFHSPAALGAVAGFFGEAL